MWKTYFAQATVGDLIQFQIHVSDKGLPQVCWLQRMPEGVKRAGSFPPGGFPAKAPRLSQFTAAGPQLTTPSL